MYSKTLEQKIDKMFNDLNIVVNDILKASSSINEAAEKISMHVGSETATRSKMMLSDMYTELSKQVIDSISDLTLQNRFYEGNLRQEIFDKYSFTTIDKTIDFKELEVLFTSTVVGAGTAAIGGILAFSLSPTSKTLPIALVVAASICAFCLSYLKVTPDINKTKFRRAVNDYLNEEKMSYIAWFDEVEHYFNKRVDEICRSL